MATFGPVKLGFALALLLAASPAQSEDKCRTGCHGVKPNNFKYAEGTTYKYNLDGNVDVALSSAEGQISSTKLKATVLLTQQGDCNQILRLQNVQIIGADAKKYGNIPNIEKPVRLNFHDGHVEDLICAEPGDTQVSLNIKRAVASMFQANLKKQYETDVFGVCPTDVNSRKEGNVLVIQKTRNLNRCSHRESVKQDFMATSFNLHSEIKSSPILNSDYFSEQRVKNGILDHATTTENYLYVPFSVGKNGAKATVTTKLQYVSLKKESPAVKCSEAKSILFENPHPVVSDKSNVNSILAAVKETVKTIGVTVGDQTANKFLNLIRIMRAAKRDDLLSVYNQVKSGTAGEKETAKKVYLDALFRSGTGDTVEVAIELLKNKQLSTIEQKLVYLGLAFVRHATPGAINTAATLLDQPNLPREAYLGIGTLAGRYCKTHACQKEDVLGGLNQKLVTKLGNGKATNREKENEIISILKAFANMDHLDDSVVAKIIAIAQDKKSSNRLRVAALETYQSDACKDKLRDSALNILKDIQQDSEIRIKAYLAVTQCPNGKVASALKALLESEPSYQVGGFIVSHLRNLRASANPDKELAKQQLSLVSTNKRFPFDFRKFSYNTEFSYAIESLGLATSTESNVIFSQNSYLPRSSNWNMTAELFGHTFNFLEIGTRQENLDKVVEHYLGPLGVLRKQDPEELLSSGKVSADKIFEHLKQRLSKTTRGKRDVSKADIDSMNKQVQIKTNELNTDLDLDLSVKIFGSEFLFLSLNDDSAKFSPDVIIDKIFDNLDKGIDKAKNFEHSFRSNMVFLDAELSYPTSLGFPIKISVEGASTLQLQAKGSIDIFAIFDNARTSAMKVSLIPSANIEVTGRFTVDAHFVESGLKVASKLFSATGGSLDVEYFKGGLDAKFSLPVAKQQLISATHEVVLNNRELGLQENNIPLKFSQGKDFAICVDQLNPIIGLTFCADLVRPNVANAQGVLLPFPLDGNSKLGVTIEREGVSYYHYREMLHEEPNKLGLEQTLEVVGADKKKLVSFNVEAFLAPDKYIKVSLDSALKKAELEARITNQPTKEKSLSLKFSHDTVEYFAKLGVSITGTLSKAVYKPLIEYKIPNVQGGMVKAEGQIIAETGEGIHKYTFDNVKLIAHNQKSYIINGNIGTEGHAYYSDITIGDGKDSGSLKGRIQLQPHLIKLNAEIQNTLNPHANVNVKYEYKSGDDKYDSNFQLIHGKDLNNKNNLLKLVNHITNKHVSPTDYHFATKNSFSYPLLTADVKFDLEAKPKSFEYDFDFNYSNVKVGSELELGYNKKAPGDYELELDLHGFNNKVEIKAKRDVEGETSKIENSLELNGKKIEISGKIKHHYKPKDINAGADLVIKMSGKAEPLKISNGLIYNPNELDSFLKIQTGSNVVVDIFLKGNKGGNANGVVKINIKDLLVANGQVKAAKGKGSANIVVNFVKLGRKMKAESTFTIAAPTYDVELTLYPSFEKDNNMKLVLSTHNKLTENAIDSKNIIDILGKKLEANLKATKEGQFMDGKQSVEYEVTLPCNMYFTGKINREVHIVNGAVNGDLFLNLEQRDNKNAPGRKFSFKAHAKDTNFKEGIYDVTYNLGVDNSNGKTLNGDVTLKRTKQGDRTIGAHKAKFYGSILPNAIEFDASNDCQKTSKTYKIMSKCGPKSSLNFEGSYNSPGEGKPCSAKLLFDLHTPSSKFSVLKLNYDGSLLIPTDKLTSYAEIKGSGGLFIDDDGSQPEATVDLKGDFDVKVKPQDGQIKGSLQIQKEDPISVALGYGHSDDKGATTTHGDLSVQYAKGKTIKADATLVRPHKNDFKLDLKVETPSEQVKNTRLQVHGTKSEDNQHVSGDVILTANDKTYELKSDIVLSKIAPSFDVQLKHPDGKTDKIIAKVTKSSPKEFGAQVQIEFPAKNFDFNGKFDGKAESIDDFTIKATVNSPALKLNNVVVEANNKGAKGAKKIQFTATAAGKNLVSGSTTYKSVEEGGKFIVEGSGTVKVNDESQSANFKYTRQNLELEKNGEQGIDITFDASVGSKAVDAEMKLTNKQFRILNSYCEEKKQCAHFEVDSKINSADPSEVNHELEINIDLRKLGLSHEFGLKAVTKSKGFVVDHTVDIHFQSQENSKYQYSIYVHPSEAGATLTTPKRTVSIEGKASLPKGQGKYFPIKGDLLIYLDKKNQPNKKTVLSGIVDHSGNEKSGTMNSALKLSSPGLSKELSISYTGKYDVPSNTRDFAIIIDVFANANQKIEILGKSHLTINEQKGYGADASIDVKCPGLNMFIHSEESYSVVPSQKSGSYKREVIYTVDGAKYVSGINLKIVPTEVNFESKLFNRELVNVNSKIQISKESQVMDTTYKVYGFDAMVTHTEMKNFNTFQHTVARKETPNNKLMINAGFIMGQIADYRAKVTKDGKEVDLIHATVKLDDANFLKSDYGIKFENIKNYLLVPAKERLSHAVTAEKELLDAVAKDVTGLVNQVGEKLKNSSPNFKPTRDYYASELHKMKEELIADKTIKQIAEFLTKVFGAAVQSIGEILGKASAFSEKIAQTFQANFGKIIETIQKELIPQVKQIIERFIALGADIAEKMSDITFLYLAKLSEFLEAHQAEIKQLATAIGQVGQDVGRFLMKSFEEIRTVLTTQLKNLYEELKALPIYEELKAKYQELTQGMQISEPLINAFKEAASTLKDVVPSPELKNLITDITAYVEKKLRNEPVDDLLVLQNLFKQAAVVIKKLLQSVNIKEGDFKTKLQPISLDYFFKLPKMIAIRLSPLAYIVNGEYPNIKDFLHTVSFNPSLWVPPFEIQGIIAQGQHIFTFDGKHITFPGKCNYLFARDAVNGNFSIIGTYTNGLLTAITVTDKHDAVTMKKDGQIMLNNAAAEFPVRKGLLEAFRRYESMDIVSKAGVEVRCSEGLTTCIVLISGFYHGQLRGLLGNGNNEAYDDFTLPNGKIVTSESDFGNAYKMATSCPAIKTVDHSHHTHTPACNKYFGDESSLRVCYPFVDPENYRMACDHGIAAGVQDTEYATVAAYIVSCHMRGIPIPLPEEFLKCKNGDEIKNYGEKFSVKTPVKAADIVLAIDQIKTNEPIYKELVQPLVAQLITELNAKGISDIDVHVIGYGGESQEWPSHYTVAGKLTTKGKLPQLKFTEAPKHTPISLGCSKLEKFVETLKSIAHDVNLAMGRDAQSRAYIEGINYPFRAHASKILIAATGDHCQQGRFMMLQKIRSIILKDDSLKLNLITPFENFQARDAKHTKTVVGFNDRAVFTADKKKEGNSELRKELTYDDYCVDYTIKNNGNVFVTNNFQQAKGGAKKQFVQVVSHNIVDQVTAFEQGLDCECQRDSIITGKNVCKVVSTKEKHVKKGGMKG